MCVFYLYFPSTCFEFLENLSRTAVEAKNQKVKGISTLLAIATDITELIIKIILKSFFNLSK